MVLVKGKMVLLSMEDVLLSRNIEWGDGVLERGDGAY